MRVAIGQILQESDNFSLLPTTLQDFRSNHLVEGADVLPFATASMLELGGFTSILGEHGVDIVPLLAGFGAIGGAVTADAYAYLREGLLERLRSSQPVDGVLLSLHGAMAADSEDDPEGDVLQHVREIVGPKVPVVATLDPHASVTRKMVTHASALLQYHTIPHVDHFATGQRAAALLLRLREGAGVTATALVKLPLMAPADHHDTSEEPMHALFAMARAYETRPGVLAAGLYPVQPWLDIPEIGWAAVVTTDGDTELARGLAQELAQHAWDMRERFVQLEQFSVDEALDAAERLPGRPVIVSDQADNTGGGAPGDSTALLRAALARPGPRPIYLTVTDPETVAAAVAAGPAATITADVGGKIDTRYHKPVRLTARITKLTDGQFTMTGATWHGQKVNMGRTAVLEVDGIHVVTTERLAWTLDPDLYRSVGLTPETAKVIQVKSPVGYKASYRSFAAAMWLMDTPGCTTNRLESLPFARAPRPLFPLERDAPFDVEASTFVTVRGG